MVIGVFQTPVMALEIGMLVMLRELWSPKQVFRFLNISELGLSRRVESRCWMVRKVIQMLANVWMMLSQGLAMWFGKVIQVLSNVQLLQGLMEVILANLSLVDFSKVWISSDLGHIHKEVIMLQVIVESCVLWSFGLTILIVERLVAENIHFLMFMSIVHRIMVGQGLAVVVGFRLPFHRLSVGIMMLILPEQRLVKEVIHDVIVGSWLVATFGLVQQVWFTIFPSFDLWQPWNVSPLISRKAVLFPVRIEAIFEVFVREESSLVILSVINVNINEAWINVLLGRSNYLSLPTDQF